MPGLIKSTLKQQVISISHVHIGHHADHLQALCIWAHNLSQTIQGQSRHNSNDIFWPAERSVLGARKKQLGPQTALI